MRSDQNVILILLICWIGKGVNGGLYLAKPSAAVGKTAVTTNNPSSKGNHNAANYGVHLSIFRGFKVKIVGRGIKDEVEFNQNDDVTVYKNNEKLLVGKKLYSDKPNSMIVINNDQCMERKYSDGELIIATRMQPKDCEAIKKKMAAGKNTAQLNNEVSIQNGVMDVKESIKDVTEEEEIKSEEEEMEEEEEVADQGDYIDFTATDPNIPRYYAKNWGDIFGNRRIDILGNGIIDYLFRDTYTMHSDKKLVIGDEFYSDRPNSLIEVIKDGSCVERKYRHGTLVSRTEPVTREECTRVKKALAEAYLYIKSGAWKRDGKGNTVQNFN